MLRTTRWENAMRKAIETLLDENIGNFTKLKSLAPSIERIARLWIDVLRSGHKIILCGNGGSAADAQHLAAELTGRYKRDRPPLAALSLTTNTSEITAIGNDYGFAEIFSRPLRGLGRPGDCLLGISTSGDSPNVLAAFHAAAGMGIHTVGFTGASGGKLKNLADICLCAPSAIANNIQEMHIACGHIICGIVEDAMFGKHGNICP